MTSTAGGPLVGVRVLDFGHAVMGPCCGMILADLGAEVIKVEPSPNGDPTRYLKGFGTGYFGYFNRNKRSITLDLKSAEGLEEARRLVAESDVLIENFAPGTMNRLGLDAEACRSINPALVFASLKGFLPGPYENRAALDEVVQMMSGLAYMTGPSGRPLRAGTSVIDITGAMFAVIAILAALRERDATGTGQKVEAALFETAVFMMGQHLCYQAQTPEDIPPMPERVSAWAIYDVFELGDGTQLFVGVTTDQQWRRLVDALGNPEWASDPRYATNNDRVAQRASLLPQLIAELRARTPEEVLRLCDAARISYAPIAQPRDLFEDEHLAATGGLVPTTLTNGVTTALPRLPIRLDGQSYGIRRDPPQPGEHNAEILSNAAIPAK